jgi:hypothetical protein
MAKMPSTDKFQANPAVKAAQEILKLATPDKGKDLTDAQQDKLFSKCEATIGAHAGGFVAVGVALEAIRCNALYKLAGFKTFDDYCEARWSFGRARASQLIKAATVVNNCNSAMLPPPANEGQARELGKLEPEQQIAVWRSISKKPAEKITAKVVAKAVEAKLKPKQDEKSETEQSGTTPKSEHLADETLSNESDAGAEEEAAAESTTDTVGDVHDGENPDEASADAVTDDDDGMVVMIDEAAEVDEGGAAAVPVEADAAAEDDSPIGIYLRVLEELPAVLDDLVEKIDDIAGQAIDSESAMDALGRIAIKIEILREAEEALCGVPA